MNCPCCKAIWPACLLVAACLLALGSAWLLHRNAPPIDLAALKAQFIVEQRSVMLPEPAERAAYLSFVLVALPALGLALAAVTRARISERLFPPVPVLLGLSKSVQICPLSASVSKILNMAMMAAYERPLEAAE